MTGNMAPFDQSRQLWYDLPGEERSNDYGRWLNLRGDNGGNGDGNQGGGNKGERDDGNGGGGNGGNGGNGDNGGNGGNGGKNNPNDDGDDDDGKKDKSKNNPNPSPAAATPAPAVLPPPPPPATTTSTPDPTTSVTPLQPLPPPPPAQPAFSADPTPDVTLTSTATSSTTEESTTSATPIPTLTEQPLPTTFVPASISSSSSSLSSSTSPLVSTTTSSSATVTSITATTTETLVLTTSSSQRKGEDPHHDHSNATSTAPPSLADTTGGNGSPFPSLTEHHNSPLSPAAEHVLLAAGIIGAFILSGFLLYLFVRIRKIDVSGKFDDLLDRYPRLERMLSVIPAIRKRSRWSVRSSSPGWDENDSRAFESTPAQKSMGAFYSSSEKPTATAPASNINSGRETLDFSEKAVSYGMSTNPKAPLTITNPSPPSATMSFYNVQPPANAYMPKPNAARMSELSSLSSGFGDAQIDVPESGPTTAYTGTLGSNVTGYGSTTNTNAATVNTLQPYRQSFMRRASRAFAEPLTSRFSWTTAKEDLPAGGQRDTMYTATSEDSAPRFRTIHSWVKQQTSRVERGKAEPVPSMPPLPPSQRQGKRESEEPAFRQHPGDQVNIPETTRIESAILDRKLTGT